MKNILFKLLNVGIVLPTYGALHLHELYYLPWYDRVVNGIIPYAPFVGAIWRTSLFFLGSYFVASIIKLSPFYKLPTLLLAFYVYVPVMGVYAWPYMLVSLIQPILVNEILFMSMVILLLERIVGALNNAQNISQ